MREILSVKAFAELPLFANELTFSGNRPKAHFPYTSRDCARCANCQVTHFKRFPGRSTIYVGDRLSDICPALAADLVFAKDSLAEYLGSRGVAFQPFASLGTVADFLIGRHGAATAWRREPRRTRAGAAAQALADEHPDWDLQFGAGVASMPAYSGAIASSARLRVWVDGAYRTADLGTFSIDSGSLTIDPELRWDFVDSLDLGLGVLLGYRSGRGDSSPGFASANGGSARLSGLPNISGAIDVGVVGHFAVFGVPLFALVRLAVSGPQGTLLNVGVYLPLPLDAAVELTVLPTVTWANGREMRAFYGLTAEQSTTTGFAAYSPSAGWENAQTRHAPSAWK